jgi:hypothetical protein
MVKNIVFFILIAVFAVVNIVDAYTATFILPGEANPIYLATGSILPVIVLKVIIVGIVIFTYKRNIFPSNFTYYNLILLLLLGNFLVGLGITTNIIGMNNPELLEQAANVPAEQKASQYFSVIGVLGFIPYFISLLAFKLYEISISKTRIDKQYYKDRKWWKI